MRIGYKTATVSSGVKHKGQRCIVKLQIMGEVNEGRLDPFYLRTKKRCSKVKVLAITDANGKALRVTAKPYNRGGGLRYTKGKTIVVKNYDTSTAICAPGIHFFDTFDEAANYYGG